MQVKRIAALWLCLMMIVGLVWAGEEQTVSAAPESVSAASEQLMPADADQNNEESPLAGEMGEEAQATEPGEAAPAEIAPERRRQIRVKRMPHSLRTLCPRCRRLNRWKRN